MKNVSNDLKSHCIVAVAQRLTFRADESQCNLRESNYSGKRKSAGIFTPEDRHNAVFHDGGPP